MSVNRCPFCERVNPPDSKFCGNCGAALHLVPCTHCGAVTDVTATVCYQCRRTLPGRGTDDFAFDPRATAASIAEISVADVIPPSRDDKLFKLLPHEFAS